MKSESKLLIEFGNEIRIQNHTYIIILRYTKHQISFTNYINNSNSIYISELNNILDLDFISKICHK